MDYSDIQEKLTSLNDSTLSSDAEKRIRLNIQEEIARYRDNHKRTKHRNWNSLGSIVASAAAIAIFVGGYLGLTNLKNTQKQVSLSMQQTTATLPSSANRTTLPSIPSNTSSNTTQQPTNSTSTTKTNPSTTTRTNTVTQAHTTTNAAENSTSNSVTVQRLPTGSVTTITYTKSQQTQMLSTAQAVGVTGYVPTKVVSGDSFILVKNGGPGSLIIDYHTMWLIETNTPQASPQNADRSIQIGNTYITVANMQTNEPALDANIKSITASFVPISQLSVVG